MKHAARRQARPDGGAGPWRTCVGCRRARPQAELLRLVRAADGSVEADPGRRRHGRGAYLCRSGSCLEEVIRRPRWGQAFRAPARLGPETAAHLRALLLEPELARRSRDGGMPEPAPAGSGAGRPAQREMVSYGGKDARR